MNFTNSILEDVRTGVGLEKDNPDFDADLKLHINSALSVLRQNGVILPAFVTDTTLTWADIKRMDNLEADEAFGMVPLYISLSTKMIFDPPPPSTVDYYSNSINGLLWRLKLAYEGGENIE